MSTYEMKITLELRGDKKDLLRGYDSLRKVLESMQLERQLNISISEPKNLEELPPEVAKWILQEKRKISFKDLALAILYLRGKDGLTKAELEAEGGAAGVDSGDYHKWLDKTLMSYHGGMKGIVVVSTKLKSGAKTYSLSTLGKHQAETLIERIRKQYSYLISDS